MDYTWHDVADLPDHDGWIWVISGQRNYGSKIKSIYYKQEDQVKHGHTKLREIKLGVNTARYWMWQIPIDNNK